MNPCVPGIVGRFLTTGPPEEKPPRCFIVFFCLGSLMFFHLKLEFCFIRGDKPASVHCIRGCVLQMFLTGIVDLNYLVKVSARIPHYLLFFSL